MRAVTLCWSIWLSRNDVVLKKMSSISSVGYPFMYTLDLYMVYPDEVSEDRNLYMRRLPGWSLHPRSLTSIIDGGVNSEVLTRCVHSTVKCPYAYISSRGSEQTSNFEMTETMTGEAGDPRHLPTLGRRVGGP